MVATGINLKYLREIVFRKMNYSIENPKSKQEFIELPKYVVLKIQRDYITKTYYWSVGLLSMIIGFLLGISV